MRVIIGYPVLGIQDLEEVLDAAGQASAARGEIGFSKAEIEFGCANHPGDGLDVYYEDGILVMLCRTCGHNKGQIEVAQEGRIWPMEYKN